MNTLELLLGVGMGYVWNDFGVLLDVAEGERYLIVTNTNYQSRLMAKHAYKDAAVNMAIIAKGMINQRVRLRTSQNTDKWSPDIWFSAIEVIES